MQRIQEVCKFTDNTRMPLGTLFGRSQLTRVREDYWRKQFPVEATSQRSPHSIRINKFVEELPSAPSTVTRGGNSQALRRYSYAT